MAPPTGVTPVARAIDTTGFRSRLIFADQLRQLGDIRCNPSRLIFGEQWPATYGFICLGLLAGAIFEPLWVRFTDIMVRFTDII